MTECTQCGSPTSDPPVESDAVPGEFCCRGCLETYRLLSER